jgi:hypothetical protein
MQKTPYIVTKQNTHIRDNTPCVTYTLFVQFMLILTRYKYICYDFLNMILANIQQCTLQIYTPVHTANINNSVHCICMYHVLS